MSKRVRAFTEEKYERWMKEGRGTGIGSEYKPWITIQDVPSKGRCSRILGTKTKRQHELLSDQERNYFYILEYSCFIQDIREQFPLDRNKTQALALELGIKHPRDYTTNCDIVMTTDFVITTKDNRQLARTIKSMDDLNKKRQMEKFEIERRYWASKEIDWGIVTDKDINMVVAKNISIIYPYYDIEEISTLSEVSYEEKLELVEEFIKELVEENIVVRNLARNFGNRYMLPPSTGIEIFKHLLMTKRIKINLLNEFNIDLPQKVKKVNDTVYEGRIF